MSAKYNDWFLETGGGSASLNPPGSPNRNQGISNRDNEEIDTDGATNRGLTTGSATPRVFDEYCHQFCTFWRQMSLSVFVFFFNFNILKCLTVGSPLPAPIFILLCLNLQVALVVKNSPANAGGIRDTSSIPGSERSFGGGHGNPPQCSCLENPMDRGAWWVTVHRVTESDRTEAI